MHVQDQKPSGTTAGASVAGDNDRDLNTVLTNQIAGASLNNNEVTLPAGTYFVQGRAPFYRTQQTQLYLKTSADVTLLSGGTHRDSASGTYTVTNLDVNGEITLTETTAVKLVANCANADADGLGRFVTKGVPEVYSDLMIWQLDAARKLPVVGEVPLESFQSVDMTGLATVDLDASLYDTFELHSIDTATAITVINMDPGRTIIINLSNGVAGNPTITNTIKYTDGTGPEWTAGDDTVVLTKLSTDIVGAFNLNQV